MEKIRLGKTEILASQIGFGCLPLQRQPMDDVTKLLRKAYDSGINYFDTARMYSDSEEKIGVALSDVRNHIYLATKSHHFTAQGILEDLETSLRLMKTDHVDVLQVHNPPFCPKPGGEDGVYDALLRAKQEGKLLHIGITNHREHVAREAVESGLYDLLQFPFAYLSSESEHKLKDDCIAADVGFVAMKPFGGGVLNDGGAVYHFFSGQKDVLPIYGMQHMWELEQMLGFLETPPDEAAAKAVIDADDAVDYDFNTITRMLAAEIAADPGKVDAALDVLMVIKYLERIGDHAVNIAEWVEFLRTGRYHHEKMF